MADKPNLIFQNIIQPKMEKKKTNTKFIIIIVSLVLLIVIYGSLQIHSFAISWKVLMMLRLKYESYYTYRVSCGYVVKFIIKLILLREEEILIYN
jgi:hypothetical protein